MENLVIGFAGLIGTGKSELSRSVATILRWRRASFGDYIRSRALQRNIDATRQNLQSLGEAIIFEEGWETYCRSVLAQTHWAPGQPLVLDGLRHSEALQTLKRIVSPMEVKLVFLEIDEPTRRSRLRARDGQEPNSMEELDKHSTEIQVAGILRALADLVLDSRKTVAELSSTVVGWIQESSHQNTPRK